MTGLIDPSQINYCPLCNLCPAPLGVCCFIWAALILVLLIILVALTGGKYRCPVCGCRVKKRTKLCPDCGYNFVTGEPPAYARHVVTSAAAAKAAQQQAQKQPVPAPGDQACPRSAPRAAPRGSPRRAAIPGHRAAAPRRSFPARVLFLGGTYV